MAIFLGSVIGGVTFTGSLVAFAKLNGNWKSDALEIPGRDFLNSVMGLGLAGLFVAYMTQPPEMQFGCGGRVVVWAGALLRVSPRGQPLKSRLPRNSKLACRGSGPPLRPRSFHHSLVR